MNSNGRIFWLIVVLIALALLAYIFRTLLVYLIISVVIGFIGDPIVSRLRRIRIRNKNLPGWLCAAIVLTGFTCIAVGLGLLFVPLIVREAAFISGMDISEITVVIGERFEFFSQWLDDLGLDFQSSDLYSSMIAELKGAVTLQDISGAAGNVFSFIGSLLAGIFSVLFMSFFFLKDGSLFYRMVFAVTPDRYMSSVKNILSHSHRMLSRYFAGLFLQALIMTGMISLGLWALGIQNAFLIGVFAGLSNVVPYLGPLIAAGFGLFIGVTSGLAVDSSLAITEMVVKIIAVFGVAQFLDNWIIQPVVIGPSVNVHPLELFVVLLASATVGGIAGMALALPVYTILRIVAREFFTEFKLVKSLTRDMKHEV